MSSGAQCHGAAICNGVLFSSRCHLWGSTRGHLCVACSAPSTRQLGLRLKLICMDSMDSSMDLASDLESPSVIDIRSFL